MGKSKTVRTAPSFPNVVLPEAKTMLFSFKHLDTESSKFSIDTCSAEFWAGLFRELKRYSLLTVDEFTEQNNTDGRHIVDFEETSEPQGFSQLDTEQVGYSETWQFRVGPYQGRVHGLLVDALFYIVWLDPDHRLYDGGVGRHE